MNDMQAGSNSALFGSKGHIGVSRGLSEFQARRPILITATGEALLTLPVEGLDAGRLFEFTALCGPVVPRLIITQRRALALSLDASTPMALQLAANDDAKAILALVPRHRDYDSLGVTG
jgi:GTP cyclohydrolase II